MSDNTVILEVNDLHKSYGDHEVLKGISTTIKICLRFRQVVMYCSRAQT